MRDYLLRTLVLLAVVAALLTEFLSAFHWLRRGPLAAAWLIVVLGIAFIKYRATGCTFRKRRLGLFEAATIATIAAIAGVVGFTAILSPPNSADAMAYHMPRVVYWAQAGSVAFFPTPYLNQVMLQPMAEYLMLHTYVLTGGDRLINLVAFGAFLGCIAGVSSIAGALGLGARGQAFAALFCATLPNGILQASGAKNDLPLAFFLVCTVYFTTRANWPFAGFSAGLALATKATAYLFLPPMLAAAMLCLWHERRQIAYGQMAVWMLGGVLLINTPQYVRNLRLSGWPLGYDSAQGNGFFRWRNERFGWKPTVSNALRHTSEQLGARSPRWNQAVYRAVVSLHRALGIDPEDPGATWRYSQYQPPLNANHEANANNRWHLLLLAAAAGFAAARRKADRRCIFYAGGLLAGFLMFCLYLKWQPFMARLVLPLFVLAAPLAAALLEPLLEAAPPVLALLLCLGLVNNARPALFENWTRPLKGPHSLWRTAREDNYFRDMVQWNNRASYLQAVDLTARSRCALVGIDITENQLEYPFQALLRARNPGVRFMHTGTRSDPAQLCAVLCPDCLGKQEKIARYRGVGPPVEIGSFLLFVETKQ